MAMASNAKTFLDVIKLRKPEDFKQVAPDILLHRIVVSYEAEAEEVSSTDIVQRILDQIEVP